MEDQNKDDLRSGSESRRARQSTQHVIEALIFGSDEPLTLKQIVTIITSSEDAEHRMRISDEEALGHVRELNAQYVQAGRAFRIIHVGGGYQFATMPDYAEWIGRMAKEKAKRKLSQSALETLAVIAYKQPVTKPEIEAIRGVGADSVVGSLLERGLIAILGRATTPGRPLLYGTTQEFLRHFGINDVAELPKPREIDEIMKDSGFELEKELLRPLGKNEEEIEESSGGTVVGENGAIHRLQPKRDPPPSKSEDESEET